MFNSLLHSIDLKKLCEKVGDINKVYFYFVPMCHLILLFRHISCLSVGPQCTSILHSFLSNNNRYSA